MPWPIVEATDVRVEEVTLMLSNGERIKEEHPNIDGHTTRLRCASPSTGIISGGMSRPSGCEGAIRG